MNQRLQRITHSSDQEMSVNLNTAKMIVMDFTNKMLKSLMVGTFVVGNYPGLSKVFDTIYYSISDAKTRTQKC